MSRKIRLEGYSEISTASVEISISTNTACITQDKENVKTLEDQINITLSVQYRFFVLVDNNDYMMITMSCSTN